MRGAILGLLFLSLVAACVESPAEDPAPTSSASPRPVPSPIRLPNNGTDCTEVSPAVFIEMAAAQRFLPPGFQAGDAKDFLGVPGAPSGKAAALITSVRCKSSQLSPDGYTEGAVAIFVRPPNVEGVAAAASNMYELGRATDGVLGPMLGSMGWPVFGTKVEASFAALPTSGSGRVSDASGAVYSYTATAPPGNVDFPVDIRWWHNTSLGLAFFDYKFTAKAHFGALQQCSFRSGSLAANVTGGTGCPTQSVTLLAQGFSFQGQFQLLPGVRAKA